MEEATSRMEPVVAMDGVAERRIQLRTGCGQLKRFGV
jgi:hypothetical protein